MSSDRTALLNSKISRMKQPVPLQTDDFVMWSNARGNDVWAMFCACIAGDLGTVTKLVERDPNLVNCTYEYLSPIRFAARENHIDIVKYLVGKGARILYDFSDSLHTIATDRGYKTLADYITAELRRKFFIAAEGELLAGLIRNFDVSAVKEELQRNPELLFIADARGNLPVHWAALTRQMNLFDLFSEKGADINAIRPDGARPLDLTFGDYYYRSWYRDLPATGLQQHALLAGYLIAKGAIYDISVAAKMGHYERVKELLDADNSLANKLPLYCGYSGFPLRNAAAGGYTEIVQLLLERGADPNQSEPYNSPKGAALHAAITNKRWSLVRLLLEKGADPNGAVESSGNCLWMARHVGAPKEILEMIISYGGRLTLEMLAYDGDLEIISQMLMANPLLSFNEDEHRDILNHQEVVKLILQYQPDFLKNFSARSMTDTALAKWLMDHGLDPDFPDWLGVVPMHRAAADGNIPMVELYLSYGANINAMDTDRSSTPLGWAAREGKKEMVQWLLDHGADPLLPMDELWARPLAWATRRGHDEIKIILENKVGTRKG